MRNRKLKYFSMFSGIGGFELGIKNSYQNQISRGEGLLDKRNSTNNASTRWKQRSWKYPYCAGFSEIDKYATQIYKKHFPNHKEYGNVSNITWSDVEDFEMVVGGFPCQAFSIAGKRKGFKDTRGTLFFEIARCLKEKQPRLLLLENVKGLLSHDKGKTFGVILNTLDELGYDLQWQVLNSKNFGVPQNRERVFIVGHLRGTSRPEVFPIRESKEISPRKNAQGNDIAHTITNTDKYRGSYIRTNQSSTQPKGDKSDSSNSIRRTTYSDDMRIRRLTPTECERLQGFPDGWTEGVSDTQRYKCLGNAVTVNVIKAIMSKLIVQ